MSFDKNCLTNPLNTEAQGKLYYAETSVKELAYELGFNDFDYFQDYLKSTPEKNISKYLNDLQNLLGN